MSTQIALPTSNRPRHRGGEGPIAATRGASPGFGGSGTVRPAGGTDRMAGRDTRGYASRPATNNTRK